MNQSYNGNQCHSTRQTRDCINYIPICCGSKRYWQDTAERTVYWLSYNWEMWSMKIKRVHRIYKVPYWISSRIHLTHDSAFTHILKYIGVGWVLSLQTPSVSSCTPSPPPPPPSKEELSWTTNVGPTIQTCLPRWQITKYPSAITWAFICEVVKCFVWNWSWYP